MNINILNTDRFGVIGDCLGGELPELAQKLRELDNGECPRCGQDLRDEREWEYEEGVLVKKITGEYCGCGYRRDFRDDE